MIRIKEDKIIYPLISMLISILTLFYGLFTAKINGIYYFYIALYLLYFLFGYWKICLLILPVAAVLVAIFAGTTYLASYDIVKTLYSIQRSLAVTFSILPGLSISQTSLVKSLIKIKIPRIFVLGVMIAIKFIPLLTKEMRQIFDAMKTRGVTSPLNPKVFYRAFLLPLVVRIVNISDLLAISVETRGFTTDKNQVTVYKPIVLKTKDIMFLLTYILIIVLVPILLKVVML